MFYLRCEICKIGKKKSIKGNKKVFDNDHGNFT